MGPTTSLSKPYTFSLESVAARSANYLERLVDAEGLPYFNVFYITPAEAAHDWPDFGDVMARQLQGAIMLRHMTGQTLSVEPLWYRKLLGYLDPGDGLLYRPETTFSTRVADWGDAALTLYALVTAYAENGDPALKAAIHKMVASLRRRAAAGDFAIAAFGGFILKSLMACIRYVGDESGVALALARRVVQRVMVEDRTFAPDNTFRHGGHMHGNLRTLVGLADYALYTGDAVLYSRVDALYRYVRSEGTRFGFLPEVIGRRGDIVACETCALMDYAGLGVTLANHGHPEYWGDMERLMRNQLVESQVTDPAWLTSDDARADTEQFSWRELGARTVGAWAGWSSPNHLLACEETLQWGGVELRNKPRALQNCCGGSGVHGLFILWKNAARLADGVLSVNLHLDKRLPQAEIRGFQPYRGLLRVTLYAPCTVRVRVPEFTTPAQMYVTVDGVECSATPWGNYLELGSHQTGQVLEVHYPLPVTSEDIQIGNPGWRQYRYRVTWKGDTVVRMDPLGNDQITGYSEFDHRQVPVYYGQLGPHPLYQRESWLADCEPTLSALQTDRGGLDFWYLR